MNYWMVKSEPFKYSWEQFAQDKQAVWDGVRNYQARNNLRAMQKGDLVLFYHSNEGLCVVGIAKVFKTAYQDPTTDDTNWLAVSLKPFKKLKTSVELKTMKADRKLSNLALIKQGRLSVSPVTEDEFNRILEISES